MAHEPQVLEGTGSADHGAVPVPVHVVAPAPIAPSYDAAITRQRLHAWTQFAPKIKAFIAQMLPGYDLTGAHEIHQVVAAHYERLLTEGGQG